MPPYRACACPKCIINKDSLKQVSAHLRWAETIRMSCSNKHIDPGDTKALHSTSISKHFQQKIIGDVICDETLKATKGTSLKT